MNGNKPHVYCAILKFRHYRAERPSRSVPVRYRQVVFCQKSRAKNIYNLEGLLFIAGVVFYYSVSFLYLFVLQVWVSFFVFEFFSFFLFAFQVWVYLLIFENLFPLFLEKKLAKKSYLLFCKKVVQKTFTILRVCFLLLGVFFIIPYLYFYQLCSLFASLCHATGGQRPKEVGLPTPKVDFVGTQNGGKAPTII